MNAVFASDNDYELRNSRLHGLGLFATRDISAGTYVIRYNGPIVSTEVREKMTPGEKLYLYKIDDNYSIDGRWVIKSFLCFLCLILAQYYAQSALEYRAVHQPQV